MYKSDEDLAPEAQMITANPDLKTLEIADEDEFIVLACDGVWNSLSSQEVRGDHASKCTHVCQRRFLLSEDAGGCGFQGSKTNTVGLTSEKSGFRLVM